MLRNIIKIDEELCTGCGDCVNGCPEGAIQLIDGKARLVGEIYCDGLGACIGNCPTGAIEVEKREAEPYDEIKTMENIVKHGDNTIIAHLEHLKKHGEEEYMEQAKHYLKDHGFGIPAEYDKFQPQGGCACGIGGNLDLELPDLDNNSPESQHLSSHGTHFHGCPGSKSMTLKTEPVSKSEAVVEGNIKQQSELRNWPIQLKLAPTKAQYFHNADLLISADCVGSSYPNFHSDLIKGKTLLICCPKLDDAQYYIEKLAQIFAQNEINSITTAIMTVPCCSGLNYIIDKALEMAGKQSEIPVNRKIITIEGKLRG